MAKRSISDREISLIKAMLLRGMKNKDVQFFFNRPDLPVNTGRISGIGDGSYSNSADIAGVSDEDLDDFLATFRPTEGGANIEAAARHEADDTGPLSSRALNGLFAQDLNG